MMWWVGGWFRVAGSLIIVFSFFCSIPSSMYIILISISKTSTWFISDPIHMHVGKYVPTYRLHAVRIQLNLLCMHVS